MAKVMSLKKSFEGDAAFFLQSIILKHMAFFIVLVVVIYRTCYMICHGCAWGKREDRGTGSYSSCFKSVIMAQLPLAC